MDNRLNPEAIKWKKATIVTILVLLLLCLLIQHSAVGLYYDDFGNASLSYGYDSSAIPGTNYTLRDLLAWAKYSYNNWGGRILYALILIPMTKRGAALFGIVQSCMITALFLSSYLLVSLYKERRQYSVGGLVIAILVYFSLYGDISRYGVYWASASVLYLWPVLFFVLAAYVYEGACREYEASRAARWHHYLLLALLVPFVTLSQEQLGFAFVAWAACQLLLKLLRRKVNRLDVFLIAWSLVTYGLFLAAPGNWKRLAQSGDFAELSIFQKIAVNFPEVLNLMLHEELRYFNVLLAASAMALALGSRTKGKAFKAVSAAVIACQAACVLVPKVGVVDRVVFCCFAADVFLILLDRYRSDRGRRFMQLWVAGVASVCFLVVSPSLQMRSMIPYVCLFTLLIGDVFSDLMASVRLDNGWKRAVAVLAAVALVAPPLYCGALLFTGYSDNNYINQYNDSALRRYDGQQDRIYLLSYGDSRFRAQMPSDKGYSSIGYWMKEYYDIPQEVVLVYKPLDEYLELAKAQELDYELSDGCYDKEGSYFWIQNHARIVVTNHSAAEINAEIDFDALSGYEQRSKLYLSVNGESVGKWRVNSAGKRVEASVVLSPGENIVEIDTDAPQVDSGADIRQLYLRIEGLNVSIAQG